MADAKTSGKECPRSPGGEGFRPSLAQTAVAAGMVARTWSFMLDGGRFTTDVPC